jgi:hypothetical protein
MSSAFADGLEDAGCWPFTRQVANMQIDIKTREYLMRASIGAHLEESYVTANTLGAGALKTPPTPHPNP